MPNIRLASRPQERRSAESLPIEQPGPSTRKGTLAPIQEEEGQNFDARKPKVGNRSIAVIDKWAMWFTTKSPKKTVEVYDYLNGLVQVDTFDNVLKYWSAWNQVQQECPLKMDVDYFVFKDGIYPLWEDPNNVRGGKWTVSFNRIMTADEITQKWITFTLATCCGDFGTDAICGATLSIRPWRTTFSLWNRNADNLNEILRTSNELKVFFCNPKVAYQPHEKRVQVQTQQPVRAFFQPRMPFRMQVFGPSERIVQETVEAEPSEVTEGEEVKKKKKTRRGKRGGVKQRAKIAAREAREAAKREAQALAAALSAAAHSPSPSSAADDTFAPLSSGSSTTFSPYSSFSSGAEEDHSDDSDVEDSSLDEFARSLVNFALE